MAELTMQDGTVIGVPDNATPEQIKKIATAYQRDADYARTREAADSSWEDASTMERIGVGIAKPFVETWKGIKALTGNATDEDQADLARLESVKGAAGTTGQVVGELSTFALPGGAAGKLLQKATGAARLTPRAMLATDAAVSAGLEGTRAVGKGNDFSEGAMQGAAGAAIGAGVGKVLGKALSGVKRTPQAARQLDEGVPLTPGQASAGRFVPYVEKRMQSVPFFSEPTKRLQGEAVREWNKQVLNSVSPYKGGIAASGREGMKALKKQFKEAYSAIWDEQFVPPNPTAIGDALSDQLQGLGEKAGGKALREMGDIGSRLDEAAKMINAGKKNGRVFEEIDDKLRDLATKARRKGDNQLANFYKAARTEFRKSLPPQTKELLELVDGQYARYAVVERAAGYKAALDRGYFNPSDLQGAAKAKGSAGRVARGEAAMQDAADQGTDLFGGLVPSASGDGKLDFYGGVGLSLLTDPIVVPSAAYATSKATVNNPTREAMLGRLRSQQTLKAYADRLRNQGVTDSRVGAVAGQTVGDTESEQEKRFRLSKALDTR